MSKLLGIFAHPDDESYMAGGTVAKYVKAGWKADLVCATRGEQGTWGEYSQENGVTLAEIRQKELEGAAASLGFASVTFLDYKDGGLSSLPPGEIEDKIAALLAAEKPDVVITFEPAGITNHPDNIKLTLATTFAFQKYAEDRNDADSEDKNPPKLYYACMPESVVRYFVKQKYFPNESFGRPWQGVEDKKITTVIDIRRVSGAKEKALTMHKSQSEEIVQYLEIPNNPFLSHEYFVLRYIGIAEVFMGKNDRVSDRL